MTVATPSRPLSKRRLVIGLLVAAVFLAAVVVGVKVLSVLLERAPAVPASWRPPRSLPVSTPLSTQRIAFDSDRTGNFEVFTTGIDGSNPVQLTNDRRYDSWSPRLSPDRRTIVFYRSPAGTHDLDHSKVSLWAMSATGRRAVELRPVGLDGWIFQGHAEWSPDGASLVMFGGSRINPQIHVTDALGQNPRQVTDRPGTNLDPVFSPDGTRIAFVGCPEAVCHLADYEIYTIGVDGGDVERVTDDDLRDHDPMWSPDGSELSWLTSFGGSGVGVWDVQIDDGGVDSPRRLFDDDGITSRPQYSPDGAYIYVHRIPPGGSTFQVYRVAVDGSSVTQVTRGQPGNNEYPSP